jgi:hypothetical protein
MSNVWLVVALGWVYDYQEEREVGVESIRFASLDAAAAETERLRMIAERDAMKDARKSLEKEVFGSIPPFLDFSHPSYGSWYERRLNAARELSDRWNALLVANPRWQADVAEDYVVMRVPLDQVGEFRVPPVPSTE